MFASNDWIDGVSTTDCGTLPYPCDAHKNARTHARAHMYTLTHTHRRTHRHAHTNARTHARTHAHHHYTHSLCGVTLPCVNSCVRNVFWVAPPIFEVRPLLVFASGAGAIARVLFLGCNKCTGYRLVAYQTTH